MDTIQKLTHKGWLLFCPVYLADVDTDSPFVVERRWPLWPVFRAALHVQTLVIMLCSIFVTDYEPRFYFMITGELT